MSVDQAERDTDQPRGEAMAAWNAVTFCSGESGQRPARDGPGAVVRARGARQGSSHLCPAMGLRGDLVAAETAAGVVATIPQSLVIWGAKVVGIPRGKPHPDKLVEHVPLPVIHRTRVPKQRRSPVITAEHVAVGAASGTVYAVSSGSIRPPPTAGLLLGVAIWRFGYGGWIPTPTIAPPRTEDRSGRAVTTPLTHSADGLARLAGAIVARQNVGGVLR